MRRPSGAPGNDGCHSVGTLVARMKFNLIPVLAASFSTTLASAGDVPPGDVQIEAAFVKADTDGNAKIGLTEAKKFGITTDMFRKADTDRRGALDKKGFAAAIKYQFAWSNRDQDGTLDWKEASMAGVKSKQIFDAVDGDHDGTLDLPEYVAALVAQAK